MTLQLLGAASLVFVVVFTARAYRAGVNPKAAIIEAWANIAIGFAINFAANLVMFPLMAGASVTPEANWWGGWVYTAISILRQYVIRRWFQDNIHLIATRIAGRNV